MTCPFVVVNCIMIQIVVTFLFITSLLLRSLKILNIPNYKFFLKKTKSLNSIVMELVQLMSTIPTPLPVTVVVVVFWMSTTENIAF